MKPSVLLKFDSLFTSFFIVHILVFVIILSVFVYIFVNAIKRSMYNKKSPLINVAATVVSKRTHISSSGRSANVHMGSYMRYYATFEFDSGDRIELLIPYEEIGYLIEGDEGILSFKGTEFIGFERK